MADEVEWETVTEWEVIYSLGKSNRVKRCHSLWNRDWEIRWAQRNNRKNLQVVEIVERRVINPRREVSRVYVTESATACANERFASKED